MSYFTRYDVYFIVLSFLTLSQNCESDY